MDLNIFAGGFTGLGFGGHDADVYLEVWRLHSSTKSVMRVYHLRHYSTLCGGVITFDFGCINSFGYDGPRLKWTDLKVYTYKLSRFDRLMLRPRFQVHSSATGGTSDTTAQAGEFFGRISWP